MLTLSSMLSDLEDYQSLFKTNEEKISIAVVRPILTFFLVYELGLGLYGAWIALTLDQTTRAVCSMLGSRQTIRIKMKDSSNS